MSRRTENPVRCARQADLGCTATFPGSKYDAIAAAAGGWFFSRKTDEAFCPEHEPAWVPGWRAAKAAGGPRRRVLEMPPEGPERDAWLAEHAVQGSPFS